MKKMHRTPQHISPLDSTQYITEVEKVMDKTLSPEEKKVAFIIGNIYSEQAAGNMEDIAKLTKFQMDLVARANTGDKIALWALTAMTAMRNVARQQIQGTMYINN